MTNGYVMKGGWEMSSIGSIAMAERRGKTYFLKRYGTYRKPVMNGSMSAATFSRREKAFEDFMSYRIEINEALKELAGPGGNIILPTDWFIDEVYFVEATEFVENLISDEQIMRLPFENKYLIMLTAAGALKAIHRKKIVHSDLKRSNILAATNSAGNTVAKIIDFDRSYFEERIRGGDIGGDQSFASPELVLCFISDMSEESLANLTTKSDIFSLGLVFHDYITGGTHPEIVNLTGKLRERADSGETIYCGEAALMGAKLVISPSIKEEYLTHLLAAMLQLQPEDRPSAAMIVETLRNKTVLDLPAESSVIIPGEAVSASSSAADSPRPHATRMSGAASSASTSTAPPTRVAPAGFCAPWEGDDIVFSEDAMKAKGFVASEKLERAGVKYYRLYKEDGSSRDFTKDTLRLVGFANNADTGTGRSRAAIPSSTPLSSSATPTPPELELMDDGTLWESDVEYEFDLDAVRRSGYRGVAKALRKGVKVYALIKNDSAPRVVSFANLRMLDLVKRK